MAVNIICPQLVLHDHLLAFIYSPFVGLPRFSIPLTSSPAAVCQWFGLDYPRWLDGRFAGVSDLWYWLTDVAADSLAADAWNKIVRGAEVPTKGLKSAGTKLDDVVAFVRWLRTASRFAVDPELWDSSCADVQVSTELMPDMPTPLHTLAKSALERWNKMDKHDELLKTRSEEARVLAASQQKRKKRQVSAGTSAQQ